MLAAIFASRVSLAQKTEEEAVAEARELHKSAIEWMRADGQRRYSFCWFCDVLGLDAKAVRRVAKEG